MWRHTTGICGGCWTTGGVSAARAPFPGVRISTRSISDSCWRGSPSPKCTKIRAAIAFALVGFESTGMWLDDWPHAGQQRLTEETYEALIAGRAPLHAVRDSWVDNRKLNYEILLLPLSEDDARISMIVTGIGPS